MRCVARCRLGDFRLAICLLAFALAELVAAAALAVDEASSNEKPGDAPDLIACPAGIHLLTPSRTVLQVIDLEVHRWLEYDFDAGYSRCIVLERPVHRQLSVVEAGELLQRSRAWVGQVPPPELREVLPADAPELDVVPAEVPSTEGKLPADWRSDRPDTEHMPPDSTGYLPGEVNPEGSGVDDGQVEETGFEPQTVFGEDERVRRSLTQVQNYPWNTIGYHRHQYPNRSIRRCTAFLVGPHLALTNAHCTYNDDRGGFLRAAEFSPGQYQSGQGQPITRPFGRHPVYRFRVNQPWIDGGGSIYDYAGLNFSRPFDAITTFMPLVFDDPGAQIVNTSGYPAAVHVGTTDEENPTFAQWWNASESTSIGGTSNRLLYHDADSSGGQSGSPLWRFLNPERRVIAIHCCGGSSVNWGPRLVSQNQNLIESWLDWEPPGEPGQPDDFGQFILSGDGVGSISDSNVGATRQINEPDHCDVAGGRSMWYSWISPVSRAVTFSVSDTTKDSVLAAYTGTGFQNLNQRACDGSGGATAEVTFSAAQNATYHIAVDGAGGSQAAYQLGWAIAPPDNDDFSNRRSLPGVQGSDNGDNWGATRETEEPASYCGQPTDNSVWWSFQAGEAFGVLTIDTVGSGLDVVLAALVGDSVGQLEQIGCDGSAGSSAQVAVAVEPDKAYHVMVAGRSSEQGDIALNWSFEETPAPRIDAIDPDQGPASGGTAITITGADFHADAAVWIGTEPCQQIAASPPQSIDCVTPASTPGTADVRVENSDTQFDTLIDGFEYIDPEADLFQDRFESSDGGMPQAPLQR